MKIKSRPTKRKSIDDSSMECGGKDIAKKPCPTLSSAMSNTNNPFTNSSCIQLSPMANTSVKTDDYELYALANGDDNVTKYDPVGVDTYQSQNHLERGHAIDKAIGTNVVSEDFPTECDTRGHLPIECDKRGKASPQITKANVNIIDPYRLQVGEILGRVILLPPPKYPQYIKELCENAHFMENIRAYNQMFSMTSLGANVDKSINNGKGPYVSRISGSPRYMYAQLPDRLAIYRVHGSPAFFITFTCNTKWPKIEEFMAAFPQLTVADRADIIDRVFEKKVRDYIDFVRDSNTFGAVVGVLYRIEFQKRGLPHCHSLLWINGDSKVQQDIDVDKYVVVGITRSLYRSKYLCCNRNFPKLYYNKTYIDKEGFVHYRRRDTEIQVQRQHVWLDNRNVVPYNTTLCLRYYAHTNVEYYGWTMLIKYLFKYISKGTDRVIANIARPSASDSSTSDVPVIQIDEIKNYVEARYIGPHEACWRILDFPIHYRNPPVQTLAVHLENMQQLKQYADGRHLTYLNFPSEYAWHATDRYWQRRRYLSKPSIGRLIYIHPSAGDLFYQRTLLCHQKGCTSFADIRKINNNIYPTNKAACQALGLLSNDEEWVTALQEASVFATASELRRLFVYILIFCNVSDPLQLWNKVWKNLSDDIPRKLSKSLRIPQIQSHEKKLKTSILFELEHMLNSYSKSLKDFDLPMPPADMLLILQNRLLMEETNYDPNVLAEEKSFLIPRLNKDQRLIFDEITYAARCNVQKLIFVYGHGGTGKTFLWKAVTTALRSEEKIVLTVAASGIAALLLPSGRTAHSRFQIPLNLEDESICRIKKNSQLADLLRQTDLIIWDEAPMNDRRCFEALDRNLKDICDSPNTLFGGKSIMLKGDFRQTLHVKKKGLKPEIVDASITLSYLWPKFKVYTLMENMRLHQPETTEAERMHIQNFSNWLLNIGNGTIGDPDDTDMQNAFVVHIPPELCIPDSETALATLNEFIYDQKILQTLTLKDLQKKAIVCPKNEDAYMINAEILALVNQQHHVYLSFNEAVPHGNDGGETELLYPAEYLNSLNFAGFPPHRLELKVGAPIILLRNLNISGGLCNGTRLIVTQTSY
ncbi:DNA helicase [Tanacetum coccineum]